MPVAYFKTPIGFARIIEEDGFITSIYLLDGDFEEPPPETPVLKQAVKQLEEYFKGERMVFDLPLNQKGSDFQQQVWQQLSKIEYGKTISYLEQSKWMDNQLAIRAVASANGKNHLIIVVPCHRVIGSDGSLTGFGAGIWRKKWLLEHEAKVKGVGQTRLDL
jgi:methylated-DNA-[protein]-cysteine S-methyltransferase